MPLALSDRFAQETFDDRHNMFTYSKPQLRHIRTLCFLDRPHLASDGRPSYLVSSRSIRYTHFCVSTRQSVHVNVLCYRLNLRLSYAIITSCVSACPLYNAFRFQWVVLHPGV